MGVGRGSRFGVAVALTGLLAACADSATPPTGLLQSGVSLATSSSEVEAQISAMLDGMNAHLAAAGADYRAAMAEYITSSGGEAVGATVVAKDVGNKQLGADFVPFDPRRGWSGPVTGPDDNITFAIDGSSDADPLGATTAAQATAAIVRAMATWDGANCSNLPLTQVSSGATDLGVIAFLFGLGGSGAIAADVQHAGFRDLDFAGGVLAATITFIFVVPGPDTPTDIDGNGLQDVAFREIYYDPSWQWNDGTNIDIETVALHEVGHGLSQGHFGTIFVKKGVLSPSPVAVMNAIYSGVQTSLKGSDNGGHCSNWASWPNK